MCTSRSDCPDFASVCVLQDSWSSEGICVECADSLDCRGDMICDTSENTCKKGPELTNARCGPAFDDIHTYEIDVPLHAGAGQGGLINFELSKWPVFVSSVTFETSDKGRARMDKVVDDDVYLSSFDMSTFDEIDNTTALLPLLFSFPGGLRADDGKYSVNNSRAEMPAIGR